MKLYTWNVNGIRSVYGKGFKNWVGESDPDIVCLQELKAQAHQIPLDITGTKKYHIAHNTAQKKGYSGVAVFSKEKPQRVSRRIGLKRFDEEGRMLHLDFKDFALVNFYIPHGGRMKENLGYKLEAYKAIFNYLKKIEHKNIILAGDFNIAHTPLDLARPQGNTNNIMFTREERQQLDELVSMGFSDAFRSKNKEGGHYTWWPWRGDLRARNVGWRIDYVFTAGRTTRNVKKASIAKDVHGSDHCPTGIEL